MTGSFTLFNKITFGRKSVQFFDNLEICHFRVKMHGDRLTRVSNAKVAIFCYFIAIVGSFQFFSSRVEARSAATEINRNDNEVQVGAVDEVDHKLLHECQKNLDYRSYIKCLKREKRHEAYGKKFFYHIKFCFALKSLF